MNSNIPTYSAEELMAGSAVDDPELVIALVATLGTELEPVVGALRSSLRTVMYGMEYIRVSQLIAEFFGDDLDKETEAETRAERLMDGGDRIREMAGHGSAACALVLAKIRSNRRKSVENVSLDRNRVATVIHSLKHPDEIRLLRSVYGSRLLVVSVFSTYEDRLDNLVRRLQQENPGENPDWYYAMASRLLRRDQKDAVTKLGQRVRDASGDSDSFIWVRAGRPVQPEIQRIIEIHFGKPFETPTKDEQGMYFAYASKFRSAASGRQVGVAVTDVDGEVLVTGTNEVPKPGGGQYWQGDEPDHRDFTSGQEFNDAEQYAVILDLFDRLMKAGWIDRDTALGNVSQISARAVRAGGPLSDSRIGDLVEFGRIAHAEMAAISTAARRGTSLKGSTLYTTTFPCHECARLIIASGVSRVVYIDPYPKSKAMKMYNHQIFDSVSSSQGRDGVAFDPFSGVAPRVYGNSFAMSSRGRDFKGRFDAWQPSLKAALDHGGMGAISIKELAVLDALNAKLASAGWTDSQIEGTLEGGTSVKIARNVAAKAHGAAPGRPTRKGWFEYVLDRLDLRNKASD